MLLSEKIKILQDVCDKYGDIHIHWDSRPTDGGYHHGTVRPMEYYWYICGNKDDITDDYIQEYGHGPFNDQMAMTLYYNKPNDGKTPIRGMRNVTIKIIPHKTELMICM